MTVSIKYYVGDTGTEVCVDTGSDITTSTSVKLHVLKPESSTAVWWTGAVYDTTKIRYYTLAEDFSIAGIYKLQAFVTTASGSWTGDTVQFRVYNPFE